MGSKKKSKLNKESSEPKPSPQPAVQDSKSIKTRGKFKGGDDDKGELITDPRFSSVHWDPRFQNIPKRTSKFEIDSRFEPMFTDKRFGSSSGAVDKRGKPKKHDDGNKLRRYYRIEDDEGKVKEDECKAKVKEEESESEEELELAEEESESESEPEWEEDADVAASGESDTGTDTDEEDYDDEAVFEDVVSGIEVYYFLIFILLNYIVIVIKILIAIRKS